MKLRTAGIAALAVIAVVAVTALLIDWNGLARGWIERALARHTGRPVALERVQIRFRLPLQIELYRLRIGNPDWAHERDLFSVESASASVRLLPLLLRRELVLPRVALAGPRFHLEQQAGKRSWVFGQGQPAAGKAEGFQPDVHVLSVTDAVVRYLDADAKTDITVEASQQGAAAEGVQPLVFQAAGTYKGERVRAEGGGASLLQLRESSQPYPLHVTATAGETTARFAGSVVNLAHPERIDGEFSLQGANLEHLYHLAGVTLPATPPYRIKGHLAHDAQSWRLEKFQGKVGDSDIGGAVAYDAKPQPPLLTAELTSELLDLNDLAPLVGAPPKTGPGQTASRAQRQEAARRQAESQVVPNQRYHTERWAKLNADATLRAKQIRHAVSLPIDDLSVKLSLRNSVIELNPLRFGVAGGDFVSDVRLDGTSAPLAVQLDGRFNGLQLSRLFPAVQKMRTSVGKVYGQTHLTARGDSPHQMLASADGRLYLAMGPGEVSNLVLEAMGLDAGEVLKFLATGDRRVALHCAVANFDVQQGVAKSKAIVIATADTNVVGTGYVDLGREQMNLTFHVAPEDPSVLSARAPLLVRGSFKKPQVGPDLKVVAARGIGAVLLGLVNPVLALIPLIETGPGKDSSCGELIREARGWSRPQDGAAAAAAEDSDSAPGRDGKAAPPALPRAEDVLRREGKARAAQPSDEDAPRAADVLRQQHAR